MKELLKKLLVIAIVAAMSFAIVGCESDEPASIATEDEKDEKDTEKDEKTKPAKEDKEEEEEVANHEEAFEAFMNELVEADFEAMKELSTSAVKDQLGGLTNGMVDKMGLSSLGMDDETADGFVEDVMKAVFSTCSYEINDSKVKGDEATIEYTFSCVDFENIDEEALLAELGLETEEDMMQYMMDAVGVSDPTELASADIDNVMEKFFEKYMKDIAKVLPKMDKITNELTAVLVMEDEQWLVSEAEGLLD